MKSTTLGRRKESDVNQERIGVAFLADAGQTAVTGIDDGVIGQRHELAAKRVGDLVHRAAPQIGAANASGEERVACKQTRSKHGDSSGVFRQVEAHAPGSVAGSVNDAGLE